MPKPSRVLVLGAGKVGKSVAEMLLGWGKGHYAVTLADRSEQNLAEAAANIDRLRKHVKHNVGFETRSIDVSKPKDVKAALAGHDSVICMLPFDLVLGIADAANELGVHYFDVTEDVETTDRVRKLAESKSCKVALVPQCGLAPGYIAIAANEIARQLDTVEHLTLRVGALPRYPTNQLKYNVTWSIAGVVNEYCEPCRVMTNGRMVEVPALDGLENFSFEGIEYEAFYTSGGVGSLIETLEDQNKVVKGLSTIAYKTIRYPGHCQLMKFLLQDLRLGEEHARPSASGVAFNRKLCMDLLENAIPRTLQDVVVIFANGVGERRVGKTARREQISFQRSVRAKEHFGRIWPAIESTTAAGVCAMVDLHRTNKLPRQTGFIRQEEVSLAQFEKTPFGGIYAE